MFFLFLHLLCSKKNKLKWIQKNKLKWGGGITYHVKPRLSGNFKSYNNGEYSNNSINHRYENALGAVLKVQYRANKSIDVGLKGTFIQYKLKGDHSIIKNGNSIGFVLTYTLGTKRYGYR